MTYHDYKLIVDSAFQMKGCTNRFRAQMQIGTTGAIQRAMDENLIERVQELVDRAKKLRIRSVAIRTSDLVAILQLCNVEDTGRRADSRTKEDVETN